jgi:hypothetical protein
VAPAVTVQRPQPAQVPASAAAQLPAALPLAAGGGAFPTAPPREAKPWSAAEDALIIEMHRQRASGGEVTHTAQRFAHGCLARVVCVLTRHAMCAPPRQVTHTYHTIAVSVSRSANAVKCRWANKLKGETMGALLGS